MLKDKHSSLLQKPKITALKSFMIQAPPLIKRLCQQRYSFEIEMNAEIKTIYDFFNFILFYSVSLTFKHLLFLTGYLHNYKAI